MGMHSMKWKKRKNFAGWAGMGLSLVLAFSCVCPGVYAAVTTENGSGYEQATADFAEGDYFDLSEDEPVDAASVVGLEDEDNTSYAKADGNSAPLLRERKRSDEEFGGIARETDQVEDANELNPNERNLGEPDVSELNPQEPDSEGLNSETNAPADETDLPAKYDPRNAGLLPALRDQGKLGICWCFGALGCSEIGLIKKGVYDTAADFSERHLAYYFFNKGILSDPLGHVTGDYNVASYYGENDYLNVGGNNMLTIWHLASWCGPVAEEVAPYEVINADKNADKNGLTVSGNSTFEAYETDSAHLQNAYIIDIGSSYSDEGIRNTVKALIRKYGAVGTGYRTAGSVYDNPQHDCYFFDDANTSNWATNHNVVIVGWDDDFPKEYFNEGHRPDQNGAWLIRNSYGEESASSAQNGYFWISYEDHSLRQVAGSSTHKYAFVFDCEAPDSYENIYQYDGNANYRSYGLLLTGGSAIYEATEADQTLQAVGIGINSNDLSYTLSVYTDPDEDQPTSGTLVSTQTGSLPYRGYHTIKLDQAVSLKAGQKFSIVFSNLQDGKGSKATLAAACEEAVTASSSQKWLFYSDTSEDKTYMQSTEGGAWKDAAPLSYCNVSGSGKYYYGGIPSGVSSVIRKNYTLRIKGYTVSGNTVSENSGENSGGDGGGDSGGDSGGSSGGSSDGNSGGNGSGSGNAPVTEEKTKALLSLTLDRSAVTLAKGDKLQLTAKPVFANGGSEAEVTWNSSDPACVSVTQYGYIKALKPGKSRITVSAGGKTATCEITVRPDAVRLTGMKKTGKTLSKAKMTLSWNKTECDGYLIYRSKKTSGSFAVYKTVKGSAVTKKKLPAFSGKKLLYYKVVPYVKTSDGTKVKAKASDIVSLAGKTGFLSAKVKGSGTIRLTIDASVGCADEYMIYRRKKGETSYRKIGIVFTKKGKSVYTFTDTGRKAGKQYEYKVRPYVKLKTGKVYAKKGWLLLKAGS